jgi:hypothetical protein
MPCEWALSHPAATRDPERRGSERSHLRLRGLHWIKEMNLYKYRMVVVSVHTKVYARTSSIRLRFESGDFKLSLKLSSISVWSCEFP